MLTIKWHKETFINTKITNSSDILLRKKDFEIKILFSFMKIIYMIEILNYTNSTCQTNLWNFNSFSIFLNINVDLQFKEELILFHSEKVA
jgi:hypothetical protein